MNHIQKKILYLNIVYAIVFILGAAMALYGLLSDIDNSQMIILETFGVPMVTGSLGYWGVETHHYIKIRREQVKGENNEHN